tara:strand:- start:457 stop:723 length:267 start_codon:yes stop_codon:yes gene_type:complete
MKKVFELHKQSNMYGNAKVVPVMTSSALIPGTLVRIYNMDDDMHGIKGVYKGDFEHTDGLIKSLIVLKDESNREFNFYTLPDTIRIVE